MSGSTRYLASFFVAVAATCSFSMAEAGKPVAPPSPTPSEPPARAWHAFTANGSAVADASRLYLFAGSGADWQTLNDLWYYSIVDDKWIAAPVGRSKPGARQHVGFSCGAGQCVAANGSNVVLLQETWVYTELTAAWSKVDCRRKPCPSARHQAAMAYDGSRFYHLLFGGNAGNSNASLNDTMTFAAGAWTVRAPAHKPEPRHSAAMAFVPGMNQVVLYGGMDNRRRVFNDMWAWTGSDWLQVTQLQPGPDLVAHSMVWDGDRLVVTGGYADPDWYDPNDQVWTFSFTDDWKEGAWSIDRNFLTTCAVGAIHPGARMAFDSPSGASVFFGGEEPGPAGAIRYGDTTICSSGGP